MKRLIYRFAIWLEYRAIDLQVWAEPEREPIELDAAVIGGINQASNEFWRNVTENNVLMKRLKGQQSSGA